MPEQLRRALSHYLPDPQTLCIEQLGDGLINDTYLVRHAGGAAVLQRVNPIFGVAVHQDIAAVTGHLLRRGVQTPVLLPTLQGELAVDLGADGVFRLMTFIPGHSTSVMRPEICREAGLLVGRFHTALADLSHRFHFTRPGAHDLRAHLRTLAAAMERASAAPGAVQQEFFPLADEILRRAEAHPEHVPGPLRICHGDLKINNLRFDSAQRSGAPSIDSAQRSGAPSIGEHWRGVCLLDLDTLAHMPLCIELGDALRSWCNPSPLGEDDPAGGFDLALLRLALSGYAEAAGPLLTAEERDGLVQGVERIALELSARFLADAVHDRYFRWNPARFPSRAAHNLVRAQGQLGVARRLAGLRAQAEHIVAETFAAEST